MCTGSGGMSLRPIATAARVTCTEFVVGVTNGRERDELPSLRRLRS
jgi:hypothetical protein